MANLEASMNEPVVISAAPLLSDLVAPALMHVGAAHKDVPLVYRSQMDNVDLSDGPPS